MMAFQLLKVKVCSEICIALELQPVQSKFMEIVHCLFCWFANTYGEPLFRLLQLFNSVLFQINVVRNFPRPCFSVADVGVKYKYKTTSRCLIILLQIIIKSLFWCAVFNPGITSLTSYKNSRLEIEHRKKNEKIITLGA